MEMTLEIKQLPGEETFFKEKVEEEKVIPVLEETEMQEGTTTERLENETEVEADNLQTLGDGKAEATRIDSPKKSKQNRKQIHKTKVTVPKPFSLETEKRILSRERRGSMDFTHSKLTLSKSHKNLSQSYIGPERSSDLRGSGKSTTKTSLKPKVVTEEKDKIEELDKVFVVSLEIQNGSSRREKHNVKEAEKKKPQVAVKKQEESELRNNKLQKSSTFKALPLPSFYQQKDPLPKLETKKVRVTHSKPPLASETGKTMPKSVNKIEEKGPKVSRKIGTSAKETIGKLFRTTRNSLGTSKEKVMKAVVSSA